MRNRRLVWHSLAICLPAVAFTALLVYFAVDKAPKLVAQQRRAETMAYRRTALELFERPEEADFMDVRGKGWRSSGKLGAKGTRQVSWGHVRRGKRELVWVGNGRFVLGAETDRIDAPDLARLFDLGVPALALLVVALTAMCLRFFIRYARDRDDFVAATAHDLTTPLVALRRTIGSDDAEARRILDRLERLVGNLKVFLRMGGRSARPEKTSFSLREVCENAYSLFREDFRDLFDGDDVEFAFDGDPQVEADMRMTEQIVWNLLANALKYAAPYGRVALRASSDGATARLDVVDCGPGLSAAERRRVFDRYYRSGSAIAGSAGGFGVGLSTARELARAMGGDVAVAPNVPCGCVFTLTLPASQMG